MAKQKTLAPKRKPRAWLYKDGIRQPLTPYSAPQPLSAGAIWTQEHYQPVEFTPAEMRAILK